MPAQNSIVMKFGGACLATNDLIREIALYLAKYVKKHPRRKLVIVASAREDFTDRIKKDFEAIAPGLSTRPSEPFLREIDSAMQAGEVIVHPEIGHQHRSEANQGGDAHLEVALESGDLVHMHDKRIHQHGDQGPGFFRIPSPVSSPRFIGPYAADKGSDGQHVQSYHQSDLNDQDQFPEGHAYPLAVLFVLEDHQHEVGESQQSPYPEESVAGRDNRHVYNEPIGFQYGHKIGDLRTHPAQSRDKEDDGR